MTSKSKHETNPASPSSDPQSEAAPGVRTEAEVIADEQAAAEQAANEAPPGVTGSPLVNATDEEIAAAKAAAEKAAKEAEEAENAADSGKLVHYQRILTPTGDEVEDGTVQSVNAGSREHRHLEVSREWKRTTRAKAKAAAKRD